MEYRVTEKGVFVPGEKGVEQEVPVGTVIKWPEDKPLPGALIGKVKPNVAADEGATEVMADNDPKPVGGFTKAELIELLKKGNISANRKMPLDELKNMAADMLDIETIDGHTMAQLNEMLKD